MTRLPVVAGKFYEGQKGLLEERLEDCFSKKMGPGRTPEGTPGENRNLKTVIAPHAGYVYSGMTAAHSYLEIFEDGRPDHIIILGPNHSGQGARVAICEEDWETPLGVVKYDTELGKAILDENEFAKSDCVAHAQEHSIEVQLPFLQYIFDRPPPFVPICLKTQSYEICKSLGETFASLSEEMDMLVIASSDFTHFEPADTAKRKDNQAMEYLEFLDSEGFINFVREHRISICGAGPIASGVVYANEQGAEEFRLLQYTNSGDVTGDKESVVAYVAAEIV